MKATTDEQIFHQRLLKDDPVAFAELAETYYVDVLRKTRNRAGPEADLTLVEEAVGQAFLDYNDDPERYNPELSSLCTYLVMAAYRDFQKVRKREYRRSRREVLHPDMAYVDDDITAAVDDINQLIIRLQIAEIWTHVDATFTDSVDREILSLIINGVRDTSEYAKILGISRLSEDEQRQHVKRAKDRITRRLRRIGEKRDE